MVLLRRCIRSNIRLFAYIRLKKNQICSCISYIVQVLADTNKNPLFILESQTCHGKQMRPSHVSSLPICEHRMNLSIRIKFFHRLEPASRGRLAPRRLVGVGPLCVDGFTICLNAASQAKLLCIKSGDTHPSADVLHCGGRFDKLRVSLFSSYFSTSFISSRIVINL